MPIRIPVQTLACPVVNPVERQARSGRGGEQQRPGETIRVGLAENQVPVARQDAHMVAVFVERMLPSGCANDAQQGQLARMHVRIAVVRLVRIFRRIVGIHQVGHRTSVDHEVGRDVGLGSNRHAPRTGPGRLFLCLAVDPGIHLGELEQVFPVVAGARMAVRCRRQPKVMLSYTRVG